MPTPRKPPRLYLRTEQLKRKDGSSEIVQRWIIRDGKRTKRTGCSESEIESAEAALGEYIAQKRQPDTSIRRADQAKLGDILTVYLEAKADLTARPKETEAMIGRLNEFWGDMTANQIRGEACRQYVKERGSQSAARRELETLRAAVNHYAREYGLDASPKFTLPEKSPSRQRWLTRSEAARLLWAAYRSPFHKHLVRFILIGLYTGTRHKAILALQWMPNTTGGWVDVDRGVLYRKADGARETNKRRTPTRIPSRLAAHLRRWRDRDQGLRAIVRFDGRGIGRIEKAFRTARSRAGLGDDVKIHSLRHTRATWLMQAGVDRWEAAGSLGMTVEMLERVYGHHAPDWQKRAAEAY